MLKNQRGTKLHFKNDPFLKALGRHCARIREQRGLSIDRMAKESEQLSSSVIHRLEQGSGAVTVLTLIRYAEILGIKIQDLFDFDEASRKSESGKIILLSPDHPRAKKEQFKTLLPLYTLQAAAGYFGNQQEVDLEGWVEVKRSHPLTKDLFVVRAVGDSMLPKIKSGDLLVFKANPGGSRQGRIVLAQYRGPEDPETGGSYTVKAYSSVKMTHSTGDWQHRSVTLSPLNPDYEPILLNPEREEDFRILGEYLFTLA